MLIKDLIKKLEEIEKENGNIDVVIEGRKNKQDHYFWDGEMEFQINGCDDNKYLTL